MSAPSHRYRWRLVAIVALLTVVASSCYTTQAVDHQTNDPTTRPWWCMSTGNGGHHVDPAYAGQTKGMLSWDDCARNSVGFDVALSWAEQWPTLGAAEADGWTRMVNYVEGMGTHHARLGDFDPTEDPSFDPDNPLFPGTNIDDTFKSWEPEFLMFDGNDDDAELVGFAWYVLGTPTTPPEGFAGGNDWWHRHESLCFTNNSFLVVGENISDAACASRGGTNLDLSNYWMSHAWIVDGWQTKADVFTNHHPCLHAGGPATHGDGDACWDEADNGGGHGGH